MLQTDCVATKWFEHTGLILKWLLYVKHALAKFTIFLFFFMHIT